MNDPVVRRLCSVGLFVATLILLGTFGYVWIEDWSVSDGFFMTVITLSTVGYGETQALSESGRSFTSGLIFLSLVSMTWWSAALTSFVVEKDLGGSLQRKRMRKMINELKEHTVVCGAGLMAEAIIERLIRARISVVLVDVDVARLGELKRRFRKLHTVEGNPTDELILSQANILNAHHVVAATDSEVDNLLISITCKDMGPDIRVIARSNDFTISNRMRKAQVDEVISPCQICGDRVADLIVG
jgi:voltage-gated potassium channel